MSGSERANDENRKAFDSPAHRPERDERRPVGPMEVLEDKDEGRFSSQSLDGRSDRFNDPELGGRGHRRWFPRLVSAEEIDQLNTLSAHGTRP
jgi:hypothetical protein